MSRGAGLRARARSRSSAANTVAKAATGTALKAVRGARRLVAVRKPRKKRKTSARKSTARRRPAARKPAARKTKRGTARRKR